MLPAKEGDSLLIRYGDEAQPNQVLIDVGRKATYKEVLKLLPAGSRHLELLVISHVDRDHIEGSLQLLQDNGDGFTFDDIWFNAYPHLLWDDEVEDFGAVQGEVLTKLIGDRQLPWNRAFDGSPVRLDGEQPVSLELDGGLKITLLSPDAAKLAALAPKWVAECREANIDPTQDLPDDDPPPEEGAGAGIEWFGGSLEELADSHTAEDGAAANGSSIAFLAEFDGKRVLLGADAHPAILARSIDKLGVSLPLHCDLVKLPHHGSQANITKALLARLDATNYFISTNGSYFGHPDAVAIARIVTPAAATQRKLYFNYRQPQTKAWEDDTDAQSTFNFTCEFPASDGEPTTLRL